MVFDQTVVEADNDVVRTVSTFAGNETVLLSRETTFQNADRSITTVTTDINGDGATDRWVQTTQSPNGSSQVIERGFFANGVLASEVIQTASANGLTTTRQVDANGDGIFEQTQSETTTIAGTGARSRTITTENADGSLRSQERTSVSDDGLVTTLSVDADGDGVWERVTQSTTTPQLNGSRWTTTEVRAADGGLLTRTVLRVSDDGLQTVSEEDGDGDGDVDLLRTLTDVLLDNGTIQRTDVLREADGTLRSQVRTTATDDGRSLLTETDLNGDGIWDTTRHEQIGANGTQLTTERWFDVSGQAVSTTEMETSATGLRRIERVDSDGNGVWDRISTEETTLASDGSQISITRVTGANGDLASVVLVQTSDDGWETTTQTDLDGDETYEFTTVETRSLAGNGTQTTTTNTTNEAGALVTRTVVTTSADARTVTTRTDVDGDGQDDWRETTVRENDGRNITTTRFLTSSGALDRLLEVIISGDGMLRHFSPRVGTVFPLP